MNKWIYDIETYPNIFTFLFRLIGKEDKYKLFEISNRKNESKELYKFLWDCNKNKDWMIGYNNLFFDYPIIHYFMTKSNCTLTDLFNYTESIISNEKPKIWEKYHKIKQIDLFKLKHFDRMMLSLKYLQFSLRWPKCQDLPFKPGELIPEKNFDDLIKYNYNDVDFTYFLAKICIDDIIFRQQMSIELKHNVMNYSDVKIGEYINRLIYCELSGRNFNLFKEDRTYRSIFYMKDLIPNFISYNQPQLKAFLEKIKPLSFKLNDDFEFIVKIGGIKCTIAKGGIHSIDDSRIVKCKKNWSLYEIDVSSMYPNSIIEGNLYPKHLGPNWKMGIKKLYNDRINNLKPKLKTLDKKSTEYKFINSKQNAIKLALNGGGYGKTNEKHSWQYDPLVMMKTTIRGQLSLLMLMEMLIDANLDIELISANTDGIVIHHPTIKLPEVEEIWRKWEKITKYQLEETFYSKIIFKNVNSYLAQIIDKETRKPKYVKFKKDFLIDNDGFLEKNDSQRIVAIALKEYFINNIPVEKTVKNIGGTVKGSKGEDRIINIYDYCIGRKGTKNCDYVAVSPKEGKNIISNKVLRYYISNSSYKLYKRYTKLDKHGNRALEAQNKGFNITMFMNYEEKEDYNINFNYYINECNKVIKPIEIGTRRMENPSGHQINIFDLGA